MKHVTIIPGLMSLQTAARYCDMTPAEFQKAVAVGDMPQPVLVNGAERWRLAEIEGQYEEAKTCERKMWGGKALRT
ncbi:MAG: hypothetical protein ACRCVX_12620 [Shewanella sp.]